MLDPAHFEGAEGVDVADCDDVHVNELSKRASIVIQSSRFYSSLILEI